MRWIGLFAGFAAAWCFSELFGLHGGVLALGALAGVLLVHLQARVGSLTAELAALKKALLPTPIEPPHMPQAADMPVEAPQPGASSPDLPPETANSGTELTEAAGEAQESSVDPDQPDTIPVPPHAPAVPHDPHRAARTHHPGTGEAEGRWPALVRSLREALKAWRR